MAKKDKYTELCSEIAEKVKKNGSKSYSKTDMVSMAQMLLNTPEHEVDTYVKNDGKAPTVVTTNPVKDYRDSLKPMLKSFGVDSAEVEKINDMPFTKKHAEAVSELSTVLTKDYTKTGRKLVFPINDKGESQMSVSQVTVEKKTSEPNKIVHDEATGKYSLVPTGKTVTTKEHAAMKATNKVPYWLKDIQG